MSKIDEKRVDDIIRRMINSTPKSGDVSLDEQLYVSEYFFENPGFLEAHNPEYKKRALNDIIMKRLVLIKQKYC